MTTLIKTRSRVEAGRTRRKDWKVTGWQGLTMQVPPEWNLVGYGGDAKTGNLRLDNGEFTTRGILGIEVRWLSVKGGVTEGDLEKRLTQYLDSVRKGAKRQNIVAETQIKTLASSSRPERDSMRAFSWRADRKAVGRIWHCTACGRVIVAQVLGGTRDDLQSVATEVLSSLACHPSDEHWQVWSLYDLITEIPRGYALKDKPQLMNIYHQLKFGLGRSLDTITVEQWSAANLQIKGAYLDQWFRQKNHALESVLNYEQAETEVQGHPALALRGRQTGLSFWLGQGISQSLRLQLPATYFTALLWECPESNKIHLVQTMTRRSQPALAEEIVGRTPCHC